MALIGYTITVVAKQDNPYNVLPETDISIRKNSDNTLVNIYADEAGLIPIAQLGAKTDSNGQFTFYADASLGVLKAVWTNGGVTAAEVLRGNSLQTLSGLTDPSDLDLVYRKSFATESDATLSTSLSNGMQISIAGSNYTVSNQYGEINLAGGLFAQNKSQITGIGHKLRLKLAGNNEDAFVYVQGDSTGNETSEWVYLTAQFLANKYTKYTVKYYLWNDALGNYDSPITISSGTGSFTLHVYNASIAGASRYYFMANRVTNLYAGRQFDLIIQNLGHNGGTSLTYDEIYHSHYQLIQQMAQIQSKAEIVLTLQNFRTNFEDYSQRAVTAMRDIASSLNLSVIDIYSVFKHKQSTGSISEWMADTVHPNAFGSKIWASVVTRMLTSDTVATVNYPSTLQLFEESLKRDAYIEDFIWSNSVPANTTATNCTVAKESTIQESGGSIKITGTSGLGNFRFDFTTDEIAKLNIASEVTMMARIYLPATNTGSNTGRLVSFTSLGGASTANQGEAKGAWMWVKLHTPVSVLKNASYVRFAVYVDSGDVVYIDRINVIYGNEMKNPLKVLVTLSDYYDPLNVGNLETTVTSVAGNAVTVTPASVAGGDYRFYINLPNLVSGVKYKVEYVYPVTLGSVFARSATGGGGSTLGSGNQAATSFEFTSTGANSLLVTCSSSQAKPFTLSGIKVSPL